MITIYGIRSCDTCRNALKWLDEKNVEHKYVDIRTDGLDSDLLLRWQKSVAWEDLLNKRSITWRKIPELDRSDLDSEKARDMILNYPTVLKRPVLDLGSRVILGFDASVYGNLNL